MEASVNEAEEVRFVAQQLAVLVPEAACFREAQDTGVKSKKTKPPKIKLLGIRLANSMQESLIDVN